MSALYPVYKLGDLAEVKGGKRLPKGEDYSPSPTSHPYLRVSDFANLSINETELKFLREDTHQQISRYTISSNDVYISIAGTIGLVGIVPDHLSGANLTENAAKICITEKSLLAKRYLAWYLATAGQKHIDQRSKATSQPKLALFRIKEVPVPLPPLPVQHHIVAVLDKADALRRKRRQALASLNDLVQSVFLNMFGDPMTNPRGWPHIKLGDTLAQRPQIGTTRPAHENGQYLVVRVGELGNYNVALDRCGAVSLERNDFEKYLLSPGDILLARAIGSADHLGKASIVQDYNRPIVFDSHVMRLRFDTAIVNPVFFIQWLRSNGGRAQFMKRAGRTAVQFNINAKQIIDVDIPLPPAHEQRRFATVFSRIREISSKMEKISETTDVFFQALVQKAFKGELVYKDGESLALAQNNADADMKPNADESSGQQLGLFA